MTGVKRSLIGIGLLGLYLCGALFLCAVPLLEFLLQPRLEARGGDLEIESIRFNLDGVELRVKRYAEAELLVRGATLRCPWSQAGLFRDGFGGELHFEEVRLRRLGHSLAPVESVVLSPQERVAALAQQVDRLRLSGLDVRIDSLLLELPQQVLDLGAGLTLLRGANGETHLAATLQGEGIDLDMRVKVREGAAGLALDFVASATDWDAVLETYLPVLSRQLTTLGISPYLNPLGEGRGFLDISGYARWDAAVPEDAPSFTVLADIGTGEVYFPGGELRWLPASFGLASDGQGHVRAYGRGAFDSVRVDSWMQAGGDWAVRVDQAEVAGEVRVGDALTLSLGNDDWRRLIDGAGRVRLYGEARGLDAACIRAFGIKQLPDDLELDLRLQLSGEVELEAWQLAVADMDAELEVRQAEDAASAWSLEHLLAQGHVRLAEMRLGPSSATVTLERLALFGFGLEDLQMAARSGADGQLALEPVEAVLMGGVLRVESLQLDPAQLEGTRFRATLTAIDLAQLAAAVPQFQGELSGEVSGYLVGVWRDGRPVLTDGRLEVDPAAGARLSYDVKGLLTGGMSPDGPAYAQYRMAERALRNLALKRFRIDVFPEGNPTRPFRLEFFGESMQDGSLVPVDFKLNVNVDDTAGLFELLQMIQRGELDVN